MPTSMGRHVASEPCGCGKNSGRFHPFSFSFFFSPVCQLRIGGMYVAVVVVVRCVLMSAREKEWRGGRGKKTKDKKQKLEGFS
jgi:hypothetical protein